MLASGGSEVVDERRSWAWLFIVAGICGALALAAVGFRRRRARRHDVAAEPTSLLQVVATVVSIGAGVAGLTAQFVPGVGAHEKLPPEASMAVRAVNGHITKAEFAEATDVKPLPSGVDAREIGNVVWLQLRLKGYRGKELRLEWGSYVFRTGSRSLIAATTRVARLQVDADSDEQTLMQPIWVGYPAVKRFEVQFRLRERELVREITSTGGMRGDLTRYVCR